MPRLTARQQQVYDFLAAAIATNGYPPTLQEIARHLQVSGNLGVLRHLQALEEKGLIRRQPGSSRSIVLTDQQRSDAVTLPLLGTVHGRLSRARSHELLTGVVEGSAGCFELLAPPELAAELFERGEV
ncbi:MAG: hypothetical protein P8Y91_06315 [Desulfuromonadales bacterium]